MKPKFLTFVLFILCGYLTVGYAQIDNSSQNEDAANVTILSASYGPPKTADVWEKFTINLSASTFGVSEADFEESMKNIQFIRIRTELNSGSDIGSIDSVALGNKFLSTFDTNADGWSAMGDGAMYWEPVGGVDGGFISVEDESKGEWHWAVAPATWIGDLTDQIGKDFSFYAKTNSPGYNGVVELHTIVISRIILSVNSNTIKSGESETMTISISPTPAQGTSVKIKCDNPDYFEYDSIVYVSAGTSEIDFDVTAKSGVNKVIKGKFTASATGFNGSSVTMQIEKANGITNQVENVDFSIFPNPVNSYLFINVDNNNQSIISYSIFNSIGQRVAFVKSTQNQVKFDLHDVSKGIYLLQIELGNNVTTRKIMVN